MDAVRVDINYRPLRIGWAISSGDIAAFRTAIRLSYAFWGGRFNPIVIVDHEDESRQLVDLFRVDVIRPIGDVPVVKEFPKRFPYLRGDFLHDSLFIGGGSHRTQAQVLDLNNLLVHIADAPEWQAIKARGVRLHTWNPGDPLADVFLMHFGGFPSPEEIGIDYRAMLVDGAHATEHALDPSEPIPADSLEHPSIPAFSRFGLRPHHVGRGQFEWPGFFVGDSNNVADLVSYWNLRAADIPLLFVDPNHLARYAEIAPAWEKAMREAVVRRPEWHKDVAVWSKREDLDGVGVLFQGMNLRRVPVSDSTWNGLNLRVPTMQLGQASVLGVVSRDRSKPRISFALNDKPFSGDIWFHTQHLVASVSCGVGLGEQDQYTLAPPYVPELNERCARTMHVRYDAIRLEPGRVALVIDAADKDAFLNALPVAELMEWLFTLAGYRASLSGAGLIARQLIARLGGIQGARVFKIPGVRRLLRTHGPTAAFTRKSALDLIGSRDPDDPTASFSDHERLYIEPRPDGNLRPCDVFAYLVEKGVFRIGAELTCSNCRMANWTALDTLKQRIICELCGSEHDVTRQLVNGHWHYRRSGIMGAERNAQGAVPVALTLQQLDANLDLMSGSMYSPSLDLTPDDGSALPKCEVDFVWVVPRPYRRRTIIILGECKDRGPIPLNEFQRDVDNLRRVADALPGHRFKTFMLLAKLAPFTPDEIQCARTLNDDYRFRAILLTARELEPYFIHERAGATAASQHHDGTADGLARATSEMYFRQPDADGGPTDGTPSP